VETIGDFMLPRWEEGTSIEREMANLKTSGTIIITIIISNLEAIRVLVR